MKKRILSLLLVVAMILPMMMVLSRTEVSAATSEKEIDQSTYDALGLNLLTDEEAAANSVTAPYKEEGTSTLFAASEVYVGMNAASGNSYTLRDGFDRMDASDHDDTENEHSGAYAFYGGSPSDINADNGNTVDSGLSSNSGDNVLAKTGNGFSGIYATSVALNGGDGKDNYVAELRAYGENEETQYNGSTKKGKVSVLVFKIGDDGSRTEVASLTPKADDSCFYDDRFSYFTRRYLQELDAYFEIEAGDINGDGLDDLVVYAGRYKDEDGRRYALVDVFYATENGKWEAAPSQEIAVDAGYAGDYSKIDYKNESAFNWKEEIVRHPVVTVAMDDIDRNLQDEVAIVTSAPANHRTAYSVAHFSMLSYTGNGLEAIEGLENVALSSGNSGMVSAGCAFGQFAQPDDENIGATALIIAGWSANSTVITDMDDAYDKAAYYYIYYDYNAGQYVQSSYRIQSVVGHTTSISEVVNLEGQENGGEGERWPRFRYIRCEIEPQ